MKLHLLSFPLIALLITSIFYSSDYRNNTNFSDRQMAMCHTTTQAFAAFGENQGFLDAHKDPHIFDDYQPSGEMITYAVPGGEAANAYLVKSSMPSKKYLFVIHEWYGLNSYVKNETDKFATRYPQMNIMALDLYDGKVAENSEQASKYMQGVETKRALNIINAAQTFAGQNTDIYTVGWCFGGGWSLQTAIELGDQAKGAVMFYGMPEKDADRLQKLKCDVLAIFAEEDQWISPEVAREFKEDMTDLDNQLIVKSYEADHGFANPSNPKFDEDAASDAYLQMFAFLDERM